MTLELNTILLVIILLIIILQPILKFELHSARNISKNTQTTKWSILEIEEAVKKLSKSKTGAIIAFENTQSLKEYIQKGENIDAIINEDLILAIFQKKSPIHDGAIIVSEGRVKACSAYFPTETSKKLAVKFGARHRAALGLASSTDSVVLIVSETSGKISVASKGKLREIIASDIQEELKGLI